MPLFGRYYEWSYVLFFVFVASSVLVLYFFSKVLITHPVNCVGGYYTENMVCSTNNERILSMVLFVIDKKNNKITMQFRSRNFTKIKENTLTDCAVKNVKNWKCSGFYALDGELFKYPLIDVKYITKLSTNLSILLGLNNNDN